MKPVKQEHAKPFHNIFNFSILSKDMANISRFCFFTTIIYLDRFESWIATSKASKNITNKLNWHDLDKLFAVVFTFINIHEGSFGPKGDMEIKNSYVIIDKNNSRLKIKVFRLLKYHISVEYIKTL